MGLGGYGVMGLKNNLYLHKLRLGRLLAHCHISHYHITHYLITPLPYYHISTLIY